MSFTECILNLTIARAILAVIILLIGSRIIYLGYQIMRMGS